MINKWIAFVFWTGLVFFLTLYPFNFSVSGINSFASLAQQFYWVFPNHTTIDEFIRNLILFIPLGFSLSSVYSPKPESCRFLFKSHIFITFVGISILIEFLQIFLPGRTASFDDIIGRIVGGFLGVVFFCVLKHIRLNLSTFFCMVFSRLSLRRIIFVHTTYIIFLLTIFNFLQSNTNLQNWNEEFPFMLGNEATGDRPWNGYLSLVAMSDQALLPEEFEQVLSYQSEINDAEKRWLFQYSLSDFQQYFYPDSLKSSPILMWKGNHIPQSKNSSIYLSPNSWLKAENFADITRRLLETSEFTLVARVATKDIYQTGPARIISVSNGLLMRNFTLGQQNTSLVFRLRTPVTGENGNNPEISIPGVFCDHTFHTIVITYKNSILHIFIDQLDFFRVVKLAPYITVLGYFLPVPGWTLNTDKSLIFYQFICVGAAVSPFPVSLILYLRYRSSRHLRKD